MKRRSRLFELLALNSLIAGILLVSGFSEAQVPGGRLPTRWDVDVSPSSPWPEYPRPQMTRADWLSLNGPWGYTLTDSVTTSPPASFEAGNILVPYPYEAALSDCGEKGSIPDQRLWYHRTFTVPEAWSGRQILLHFGAVNWDSTVFVNGHMLGEHKGGYEPFSFDITSSIVPGVNEIVVSAWNSVSSDNPDAHVIGKQRVHPVSVLYTAATGIWQTVWIEPVLTVHISSLKLTPDIDDSSLHVVASATQAASVRLSATDKDVVVATADGAANSDIVLHLPHEHLWSPDDPHLYDLRVTLIQNGKAADSVGSYFAMRKVSLGKDMQGRPCIFLNNRYLLELGLLDQGYWPDGIYTAPTDAAMLFDIQEAKSLGFNLLRKHAKVEPDRWYYDCDRIGMLVWQDMPQMFGENFSDSTKAQWIDEWKGIESTLYNHPCIIVWTLFNEGWGQHDTESITDLTRQLDGSRLINSASGGYNQMVNGVMSQYRLPTPAGLGDINDTHVYPDPGSEVDPVRAVATGEYGGVGMRVAGHDWTDSNFAYGQAMTDRWPLTRRFQELQQEALALAKDRGTCAFVYTQLTDVEDETNGMLTYDRAVLKPLPSFVAAANHALFPPLPPDPSEAILMPTSEDAPHQWRYTDVNPSSAWNTLSYDDSAWKTGNAPFGQGYPGINTPWTDTPGDIWMRRDVTFPGDIPEDLTVLAEHDEDVEVYINGVLAASASGYTGEYAQLPMSSAGRAALKPGTNLIAVHCRQTVGGQVVDVGIMASH